MSEPELVPVEASRIYDPLNTALFYAKESIKGGQHRLHSPIHFSIKYRTNDSKFDSKVERLRKRFFEKSSKFLRNSPLESEKAPTKIFLRIFLIRYYDALVSIDFIASRRLSSRTHERYSDHTELQWVPFERIY